MIDEASAIYLENVVKKSVEQGAKILLGGKRNGAMMEPTVIVDVPRNADMVVHESFGPAGTDSYFLQILMMQLR